MNSQVFPLILGLGQVQPEAVEVGLLCHQTLKEMIFSISLFNIDNQSRSYQERSFPNVSPRIYTQYLGPRFQATQSSHG